VYVSHARKLSDGGMASLIEQTAIDFIGEDKDSTVRDRGCQLRKRNGAYHATRRIMRRIKNHHSGPG
jgi:hypothetical protein